MLEFQTTFAKWHNPRKDGLIKAACKGFLKK